MNIFSRPGKIDTFKASKHLLFLSLLILGAPLDGSIGQFSDGSMGINAVDLDRNARALNYPTLISWVLIYTACTLILVSSKKRMALALNGAPLYLSLFGYLLITLIWSENPLLGLFELGQLSGSIALAITAAIRFRNDLDGFSRLAGNALGIAQLLNLILILLAPSLAIAPNGRWVGMYGAPNYLGALAFCSIAMNAQAIKMPEGFTAWRVLLIAASLSNLIGSNSVTSIWCTLIFIVGFAISPKIQRGGLIGAIYFFALTAMVSIAAFISASGMINSATETVFEVSGRSSGMSGRSQIWSEAWIAAIEKPFFGHGFGTKLTLTSISRLNDLHSTYLTLFFSGGLVAIALFIIPLILAFRRIILSPAFRSEQPNFALPLLTSFLIYFTVETALLSARSPVFILFITCLWLSGLKGKK